MMAWMNSQRNRFTLLLAFCCSCCSAAYSAGATGAHCSSELPAAQDSVQAVLRAWSVARPDLVGFVPDTGRWYALQPSRTYMPEAMVEAIQDAFYYDMAPIFIKYGWKYLADWHGLMSKAARETFWGSSYLCNAARNYFGIRISAKPWACETFRFCYYVNRNDPEPTEFIYFPDVESCLWMFVHTIYSPHYLARLPDGGAKVAGAIAFERAHGVHYWEQPPAAMPYAYHLEGEVYSAEEMLYTWSEHPINNFCLSCSRASDREWVYKVAAVAARARY